MSVLTGDKKVRWSVLVLWFEDKVPSLSCPSIVDPGKEVLR